MKSREEPFDHPVGKELKPAEARRLKGIEQIVPGGADRRGSFCHCGGQSTRVPAPASTQDRCPEGRTIPGPSRPGFIM